MFKLVLITSSLFALQSMNNVNVGSVASKSDLLTPTSSTQQATLGIQKSLTSENITTPLPGVVETVLVAAAVAIAPHVKDKIFHGGHAVPENVLPENFDY